MRKHKGKGLHKGAGSHSGAGLSDSLKNMGKTMGNKATELKNRAVGAVKNATSSAVSAVKKATGMGSKGAEPSPTEQGAPGAPGDTSATTQSVASNPQSVFNHSQAYNNGFAMFYGLFAIVGVLIVLITFALCTMDIINYYIEDHSQGISLLAGTKMYLNETLDMKLMQYIKTNVAENEPFNVFAQENLFRHLYTIAGLAFVLVVLQVTIYVGIQIYNAVSRNPFPVEITLDMTPSLMWFMLLISIAATAFWLDYIYRKQFIGIVQKKLRSIRTQMYELKRYIYDNCTTDTEFMNAMLENRLPDVILKLHEKLQSQPGIAPGAESQTTKANWNEASKMIFTYSVYSYLAKNIPEADDKTVKIKEFFTDNNVTKRAIDPIELLYYLTSNPIENVYNDLNASIATCSSVLSDERITAKIGDPKTNNFFNKNDPNDIANLSANLTTTNTKINELNKKIAHLSNITESKGTFYSYIKTFWLSSFIAFSVMVSIIYFSIPEKYQIIFDRWIKGLFIWLNGFLTGTLA